MSDAQKLKDAIDEIHKANKSFDDKLKDAEEKTRLTRQEQRDELNRPR